MTCYTSITIASCPKYVYKHTSHFKSMHYFYKLGSILLVLWMRKLRLRKVNTAMK